MPDLDRRSDELQRLWGHVHSTEARVEANERLISGMHYALFGLAEVPGSGIVNTVENVRQELHGVRRAIVGLIGTAVVGIATQIVLHYT